MRELILRDINNYKEISNGFAKSLMRWKNLNFKFKHISELDFNSLNDEDLLYIFTIIIRHFYTQM